jgi:hypothetical protein
VNDAEPFMPVVKLKPVVEDNVIVPCKTDSVRAFEPLPAALPLKLMALPLLVEKTSDPFWSSVPEGGATIAGALSAVTEKTTAVAAERLSSRPESERDKESDTTCVVRPLRAAFRLAAEPDTVNEDEPLVSVVKLTPVVDANLNIPWATGRASESELPPAAASKTEIALLLPLEKTRDPFWSGVPEGGAAVAGVLSAVTVETRVVAADRLSPRSEFESDKESNPTCVALGLLVRPLKAAFRLAIVPVAVNEGEPLVPVVKLNPIVGPRVSLPCETDSVSDSELLPATASITEIALLLPLEKTSDAEIAGAVSALTVSDALVELDSASAG